MSLDLGLPTNSATATNVGVSGRQSARAAPVDSNITGLGGGFSAVLASVDDSTSGDDDTESTLARGHRLDEAPSSAIVPVPTGLFNLDLCQKGVIPEKALSSALQELQLAIAPDEVAGRYLTEQLIGTEGAAVWNAANFTVGSIEGLEADLPEPPIESDVGLDLPNGKFSESVQNEEQVLALTDGAHGTRAVSQSVRLVTQISDSLGLKLTSGPETVRIKLAKDKANGEMRQGSESTNESAFALRNEDGGFRARVSQEIRLLTQQANFSRDVGDPQQDVVVELDRPEPGKISGNLNRAASDFQSDANRPVNEFNVQSDSKRESAGTLLDSQMATTSELNSGGSYWISGDLKNAKMKLGDVAEGVVEVSIRLNGNQAQVAFSADETTTRNALQDSGSELREMLRRDGIELSGVSVGTSGSGDSNNDDNEKSGSKNRTVPTIKSPVPSLDSPSLVGLTGSVHRLDLFV